MDALAYLTNGLTNVHLKGFEPFVDSSHNIELSLHPTKTVQRHQITPPSVQNIDYFMCCLSCRSILLKPSPCPCSQFLTHPVKRYGVSSSIFGSKSANYAISIKLSLSEDATILLGHSF